MHLALCWDSAYLRFFSLSRLAAENEVRRVCREPAPGHASLLALLNGEIIGVATCEAAVDTAEIAFAALPPPTLPRCATSWRGSPGSPTTCPKSPTSTSTR
jgi:hypothetical protein